MQNMTQGNIKSLILKFAIPLFLSQLFQQLYSACDSIIVGKFIGNDALAAVSSSGSLVYLIISFFVGASMGASILIGKCFGANDLDGVSRAAHTTIALSIISGIVISIFGTYLTPTLLRLIKVDPEIIDQAISYFRIYFMGVITLVIYNTCRSIMTAVGDSKRPLMYLIFSSCLNLLFDLLFIAVFKLGVWSAALATVIAQGASALLCLIYLFKPGKPISIRLKDIKFHKEELNLILKYGIPSGIQNSVIGFANVLVQSQINSFGKIATSCHGIHGKVEGFAFVPIMSFNTSITTFISQNLGAKEYERAKEGARFGIITAMVMAQIIGIIYSIFTKQIYQLFVDEEAVFQLGLIEVREIAPFYFLLAFSHAIAAVCRGAGKATVPMMVMLSTWCIFRVGYILTVMHIFNDISYIYWAYPITWVLSSIIYFIYYKKSDWIHGFEKGQNAV